VFSFFVIYISATGAYVIEVKQIGCLRLINVISVYSLPFGTSPYLSNTNVFLFYFFNISQIGKQYEEPLLVAWLYCTGNKVLVVS
jgi:hypothetical protein